MALRRPINGLPGITAVACCGASAVATILMLTSCRWHNDPGAASGLTPAQTLGTERYESFVDEVRTIALAKTTVLTDAQRTVVRCNEPIHERMVLGARAHQVLLWRMSDKSEFRVAYMGDVESPVDPTRVVVGRSYGTQAPRPSAERHKSFVDELRTLALAKTTGLTDAERAIVRTGEPTYGRYKIAGPLVQHQLVWRFSRYRKFLVSYTGDANPPVDPTRVMVAPRK